MAQNDPYFNGDWLRKATDTEKGNEEEHQNRHILIWYELDLSSVDPLEEDHIRAAMTHLYRKSPNLGICYGTREGSVWLRRATNPEVDFKVLQSETVDEVRELLQSYHFNSETGPLFCSRLLRASTGSSADNEDLEPLFPHKYHLFFGFHHGPTDGTTNMNMMGFFITLLNDVISNRPINDDEPLGTFVTDSEMRKLIEQKITLLKADPKLRAKVASDYEYWQTQTPVLIRGFPAPKEKARTASIVDVLDQNTTLRFIQRCRREKVTVNSAFTAMANVALVDLLVEHSFIQESYVIKCYHNVNYRRYSKENSLQSLGCQSGYPLIMHTDTPRDTGGKFWDYARALNQDLQDYLLSERILFDKVYLMLTSSEDLPSKANKSDFCDFCTSNLGDVTSSVTEGGDKVRITNIKRATAIHKSEYPVILNVHTFRGRFTLILAYNTEVVQYRLAEQICYQVMKRLREFIL